MKVRLVTAIRLRPDAPLNMPGDVVEVDEGTFARFKDRNVFASAETAKPTPKPVPETVVPETVPEVKETRRGPNRPKRTASAADWKRYAEAVGVDVKGLSKQEIISAVDA